MSEPAYVGWCPQCGPVSAVDADGLCLTCGATASGVGADAALAACSVLAELKARVVDLEDECWALRGKPTRCPACRHDASRVDAGFSYQELHCANCGRTSGRQDTIEKAREVFLASDVDDSAHVGADSTDGAAQADSKGVGE